MKHSVSDIIFMLSGGFFQGSKWEKESAGMILGMHSLDN